MTMGRTAGICCVIWFALSTAATAADLLIENVTLIDGTGRAPIPGASVLVTDGRISRVTSDTIAAPARVERVDGTGKFLIPGLFDVHIHIPKGPATPEVAGGFDRQVGLESLHSFLYSGVTSVYDAGNHPDYSMTLRAEERAGRIVSPRIFATGGGVTYPKSWGASPGAVLVSSWPAGAKALDANFARQPDLQKITYENFGAGANAWVPSFPEELMVQIIAYAGQQGIRTTVHISDESHARVVVAAGAETLAHPVPGGRLTDEFVNILAEKGVIVATTLAVFDNIVRIVEDPSFLDQPLFRAVIAAQEIEKLKTESRKRYAAIGWGTWFKTILPYAQQNVGRIHRAGGIVALGTDRHYGPLTQRELELVVEAGIPALEALKIATLNSAAYVGVADRLGSIEQGKLADMVLLTADPTLDIRNARQIAAVFKAGERIDRGALNLPVNR
jgi:imidazolonepropionase-like amidohydrolase